MFIFLLTIVCFDHVQQSVYGHKHFQEQIPNGDNVPGPCNNNLMWQGVGHISINGGGPRNTFGLDFAQQGFTWTEVLCKLDSDTDGRTNGEELGDPSCVWKQGSIPERTTGITHPGICDPYNSTKCSSMNSFLNCSDTTFQCDAVEKDKDIKVVDIILDKTPVPAQETTYMCQVLELPVDKDYHLVAGKPYIDNSHVMHHAVVYGCSDDAKITPKQYIPTTCFMNRIEGCSDMIAIWALGSSGTCYHEDAGFRIGKNGYKKALIELHWNNPLKVDTYNDGSGISLYLTPNLRPYDAGMFYIGQLSLDIPPKVEQFTVNSTCTSKCIEEKMRGHINIVGAFNHMHYLGVSATSKVVAENGREIILSHEATYDYNTPKFVILDEPVILEAGHNLQLKCVYNSSSKTTTTYFGESTASEMCFTFLMYYPKANWSGYECESFKQYDTCAYDPNLQKGPYCDFKEVANFTHPVTMARNARLYSKCVPGHCNEGCIDVLRDIYNETCFQGHNLLRLKEGLKTEWDPSMKYAVMDYFYRLDSCNTELAREACSSGSFITDTNSARPTYAGFINISSLIILLVSYILY